MGILFLLSSESYTQSSIEYRKATRESSECCPGYTMENNTCTRGIVIIIISYYYNMHSIMYRWIGVSLHSYTCNTNRHHHEYITLEHPVCYMNKLEYVLI